MSEFANRHPPQLEPLAAPQGAAAPTNTSPERGGPAHAMSSADPAVLQARSDLFKGQYGEDAAPKHPWLARAGHGLGLGLGVAVTEALGMVPSWNQPLLDTQGKPVDSVPGAQRIGDHNILKRHQEVVGPKLAVLDSKIRPGALHDFVGGLAAGATEAPGASYRSEAHLSDALHGRKTDP